MIEQTDVLFWLALLPLVVTAFAAIPVGSAAGPAVRSAAGTARPQTSLIMAGLVLVSISTLLTLLGSPVAAVAQQDPFSRRIAVFGVSEVPLGLLLLALGGFVLAAYIGAHFGDGKWGQFLTRASQEAAVYWAVLGICDILVQRDVLPPSGAGTAAMWIVITLITLAFVWGTFTKTKTRMD